MAQQPSVNGAAARSPLSTPERGGDPEALAAILIRVLRDGPPPEDEELPAPVCPRCEDRGQVYPNVPPDDPRYGKSVPCICSLARLEAKREERLMNAWLLCGVPKNLRDLRLETHPNLIEGENLGLLEQLQTADLRTASWLFWGEPSVGKSGIAVGYAWWFLCTVGKRPVFWTVPDLFNALRASYEKGDNGPSEPEILAEARTADLLILDDLGKEQKREGSEWVSDRLYQIIGGRHGQELPTLFTCNGDVDLTQRYGPHLASRIRQMCGEDHIIEVKGRDLRVRRAGP